MIKSESTKFLSSMKHLSFLRRHANIVFCLLLCLVYQRAESKELFENNSLDTCYVLAIANVDLTTDLQKKYEERNIATSAIVGYIIRKSKFPQNPKRSVRFSGKRTKRSVQKRKARNTQKAETKVL